MRLEKAILDKNGVLTEEMRFLAGRGFSADVIRRVVKGDDDDEADSDDDDRARESRAW